LPSGPEPENAVQGFGLCKLSRSWVEHSVAAKGCDRVLPARRPKAVALAAKGRDRILAAWRPKAVTENILPATAVPCCLANLYLIYNLDYKHGNPSYKLGNHGYKRIN
jgi:hypothetical protein